MAETTQDLHQSPEALLAEFESKRQRLCERMASSGLAAVQLQLTENQGWRPGGQIRWRLDPLNRGSSYSGIASEPVTAKVPWMCSAADGCAPPIITEYSPGRTARRPC